MKYKQFKTLIVACVSSTLVTQLIGCGTILYPERKGQIDGRIDPGVAVMDAVGLLFFFVPGVIAFAVDFSNGTIYLPSGKRAKLSSTELKSVTTDKKIDLAALGEIMSIKENTSINLKMKNTEIVKLSSEQEALNRLELSYSYVARL